MGAETLLTTLLTLGYVEAGAGGRFANSAVSERLLVSSSPESIATFVGAQADLHWEVLHELPRAVRDGWAYAMHEERQDDSERWQAYIRGLFEISRPEHDANAAFVPLTDARRLVDVAGGHGGFAMAMCRRHPGLEATVLDLPPSAAVGRQIVEEQGYAERVSFRAGDVFELGLGEELDVVSVFNLVHHLPEERDRELCRMARAALRPGGVLVIGDSARPEHGRGRVRARRDLEPALLRLEPLAQLHAVGDRAAGWRRPASRRSRATATSARPGAWWSWAAHRDDPAHRGHGHGGLGAAAAAHRRRASRCAAWCATRAGSATSACACRSRWATWPTRPRFATPCAAWTRSCTWPPPSATSRTPRSRS